MRKRLLAALLAFAMILPYVPVLEIGAYTYKTESDISTSFDYVAGTGVVADDRGTQKPIDEVFEIYDFTNFTWAEDTTASFDYDDTTFNTTLVPATNEFTPAGFKPENSKPVKVYHFPDFKLTNSSTTAEDTIIPANNYLYLNANGVSGKRLLVTTKEQPTANKKVTVAEYTYLHGGLWGVSNREPLIPIYMDTQTGNGFFISLFMSSGDPYDYYGHGIFKWKYADGACTSSAAKQFSWTHDTINKWYADCRTNYGVGGSAHAPLSITTKLEYTYDGNNISSVKLTQTIAAPNDPSISMEHDFTFSAADICTEAGLPSGTLLSAENVIPGMVSSPNGTNVNITDIAVSFAEEGTLDTNGPISTTFAANGKGDIVAIDAANDKEVAVEDLFAIYDFNSFSLAEDTTASFDYDDTTFNTTLTPVTNEFTPGVFKPVDENKRSVKVYHMPAFKLPNQTSGGEDTIIPEGNYLTLSDKDATGSKFIFTTKEQPTATKQVAVAEYTYLHGGIWGITNATDTNREPLIPIYVDTETGNGFFVSLYLSAGNSDTAYTGHGIYKWKYADNTYSSGVKKQFTWVHQDIKNWYATCRTDYGVGGEMHVPLKITTKVEYTYDGTYISSVKLTQTVAAPNDPSISMVHDFTFTADEICTEAGLATGTKLSAKNAIPGVVSSPRGTNVNISGMSVEFTRIKDLMTDHKDLMDATVNGTTLDRTSAAYRAFLKDYAALSATAKADLQENENWTAFVAAAKEDLDIYAGDDFSDAFYTDVVWEQLLEDGNAYTTSVDKEFATSGGKFTVADVDTATNTYLVGKPINYANAKYLSFDLTYRGTGTEIYVYADTQTQTYVRFNVDNLGAMKFHEDVSTYVNLGDYLLNLSRDEDYSAIGQTASTLTGLSENVPYTLYMKYEQVGGKIQMTATLLNTQRRPLSTLSFQIDGTLTNSGWFGYRVREGKKGTLLDNLKVYNSADGMDFNVKYANLLATDPDRVTPYLYKTDISKMIADYQALTVKTDVDSRYADLAAAGLAWNVDASAYADTFKSIHSNALSSAATLEDVEKAFSVYNALDVSVKEKLSAEYAVLTGKLQSWGTAATDKTKIAFVGSSFFHHDVQKDASSEAENVANIFMDTLDSTGNDYEYLKLGISGIKLIENFGTYDNVNEVADDASLVTSFESYTFYQYLLEYDPDVVVVALGINNLYGRTTELSVAQKDILHRTYKRFVQTLEALPAAPTVILMTPYCTAYSTADKALTYNEATQKCLQDARNAIIQVQEETGCGMIDNYEFTANFTDAEMDFYYDRGSESFDDISQNGLGAADGVHGSWALQKAYADYWMKSFFNKTAEVLATNNIRILDHTFADKYEKYLGLSWSGVYRWENGVKIQYIAPLDETTREKVAAMFSDTEKTQLISESVPAFGAVSNAVNTNKDGALTFHAKFDNSVFEAFGISYQYGMIAIPGSATADAIIDVETVAKEEYPSTNLLNVHATANGTTNVYVTLNGTQKDNLKGTQIKARLYVFYDADGNGECDTYIYGDQVQYSVNATRRAVAEKMITRAYKQFFTQYASMDYSALNVAGITTGALSEQNFNDLVAAVVTNKTVASDDVYAFIRDNAGTYKGGRS